jgi:putative acetyltransferase
MMEGLRLIEVAGGEDLEWVRELFAEYERDLPFDLSFQDFRGELAALPGRYARPSGCILLAQVAQPPSAGDRSPPRASALPAGCVALRQIGEGVCEMKRLYVRPTWRGRGIGQALATAVLEEARRIGYKRIRLDTVLEPAKGLYRSLGFREIPPYQHVPIEGVVFMELEL